MILVQHLAAWKFWVKGWERVCDTCGPLSTLLNLFIVEALLVILRRRTQLGFFLYFSYIFLEGTHRVIYRTINYQKKPNLNKDIVSADGVLYLYSKFVHYGDFRIKELPHIFISRTVYIMSFVEIISCGNSRGIIRYTPRRPGAWLLNTSLLEGNEVDVS